MGIISKRSEDNMIFCPEFLAWLEAASVDFFAGVPDSLLKNFCACLMDSGPVLCWCPRGLAVDIPL